MMKIHFNPLIVHAVRTAHDVTYASILFPKLQFHIQTSRCHKHGPMNPKIDMLYCTGLVLKCHFMTQVRTDVGDTDADLQGNVLAGKGWFA